MINYYNEVLALEAHKLSLKAELARRTLVCTDNAFDQNWVPVGRPEESFIDLKKAFTDYEQYSKMQEELFA